MPIHDALPTHCPYNHNTIPSCTCMGNVWTYAKLSYQYSHSGTLVFITHQHSESVKIKKANESVLTQKEYMRIVRDVRQLMCRAQVHSHRQEGAILHQKRHEHLRKIRRPTTTAAVVGGLLRTVVLLVKDLHVEFCGVWLKFSWLFSRFRCLHIHICCRNRCCCCCCWCCCWCCCCCRNRSLYVYFSTRFSVYILLGLCYDQSEL